MKVFAIVVVALLALGFVGLLAIARLTGQGLGLDLRRLKQLVKATIDGTAVRSYSQGDWTNVIFLHHSTGQNLIAQGHVRELFTAAGYQLFDHGYNGEGLRDPGGEYTGYSYNIPNDNTDPDGLARIFAQRPYRLPLNALSGLLQHEVIIFKSCYPVSNIADDEQLQRYKTYYLAIRDVVDQHQDQLFIALTPPPLNPAATDAEAAARARAFANWLASGGFLAGHPNLAVFDLFANLSEPDSAAPDYNMLRASYRDGEDSHPNRVANETVGPVFVDFVVEAVEQYRAVQGGNRTTPVQ